MRSISRRLAPFFTLAFALACAQDSDDVVFQLEAGRFASSEWSDPVNLGLLVNSSAVDANAALSPDELALYFVSTRPGGLGAQDIWVSRRQCLACPWETPANLGAPINSAATDASPTLSEDGRRLFFFSGRGGNLDIYLSHRISTSAEGDVWGDPVNLGPDVNTAAAEQGPYYVREGGAPTAVLYFNRAADIFRVPVSNDGAPLGPAVLVSELSDPTGADQKVSVRVDGLELFLSSTRPGTFGGFDIWVFTRQSVNDPWSAPAHPDAPLNTPDIDSQPSLSRDGRTLIFTSTRPGGSGVQDLWMSTRRPSGH